jgi:hypothetical protein
MISRIASARQALLGERPIPLAPIQPTYFLPLTQNSLHHLWLSSLEMAPIRVILVHMTRIIKSKTGKTPKPRRRTCDRRSGRRLPQNAKAGPQQQVTVHGREEVVVVAAKEFRCLTGNLTGKALVAVMQASPRRDVDIESTRGRTPVRDVVL